MPIVWQLALLLLSVGFGIPVFPLPVFAQTITADGRYVMARVDQPSDPAGLVWVVQATRGSWRRELRGGTAQFTPDGRQVVWQQGDTLALLLLGTAERTIVTTQVLAYRQAPPTSEYPWLAYQLRDPAQTLVVRHLGTGREQRFPDVTGYVFSATGRVLLLLHTTAAAATGGVPTALRWVELPTSEVRTIWSGVGKFSTGSFVFDAVARQVAFLVQIPRDSGWQQTLWHYAAGTPYASVLVQDGMPGLDPELVVSEDPERPLRFSPNGQRLFVQLRERAPRGVKQAGLDIWSYTDAKFQSHQLKDLQLRRRFAAVVNLPARRLVRLEQESEIVLGAYQKVAGEAGNAHALLCHFDDEVFAYDRDGRVHPYTLNEYNWNQALRCSVYLVSLADGRRTLLQAQVPNTSADFPYVRLSPEERYVVFYEPLAKQYVSYEIATGRRRPLTAGVAARWEKGNPADRPRDFYTPIGVMGWVAGDAAVVVQDHYSDLWRLDPTGTARPVNLTNGYARRHRLHFALTQPSPVFDTAATLLLAAHPTVNARRYANAGFYRLRLDRPGDPLPLVPMGGAYRYESNSLRMVATLEDTVYTAQRENAQEPPGFWYTRDFTTWTRVPGAGSERPRGLPQELLTWTTFDGREAQGILYKPVDFDPRKRYPVILQVYERYTGEYNRFIPADSGSLSNEVAVTRAGYLLFLPDIHFTLGAPGESIYNAVVSGAQYLATLPFVDGKRLGITGGSFGGYAVNYLVTRTSLFAAAVAGCGLTDLFSQYGEHELNENGRSNAAQIEVGQYRIGVIPWDRPDVYLKNSPIFHAHQVTTPLLLYHDYNDYTVQFAQSMEMFKALRRLGKRVWLVAGHRRHCGGSDGRGLWFSDQFFDHYLKGVPAPQWMTQGGPARRKGLHTGFEPDSTMARPGPGLVLEAEVQTPQQQRLLRGHRDRRTQ